MIENARFQPQPISKMSLVMSRNEGIKTWICGTQFFLVPSIVKSKSSFAFNRDYFFKKKKKEREEDIGIDCSYKNV